VIEIALRPLQNLIHPVEFPLCGPPLGGFHRAGFCHPNEEDVSIMTM